MPRPRELFAPILLAFGAFTVAVSGAACSGTGTSDTVVPITGITVRAETLTTGRGCGRGATQIFKYAVVVLGKNLQGHLNDDGTDRYDNPVTGNVFDCFTDAAFVDVPSSLSSAAYALEVFAYNEAAYRAAGGDAVVRATALGASHVDPSVRASIIPALVATNPTYTTACVAQQYDLVQALARCEPLTVGAGTGAAAAPAIVQLSLASFPRADAAAAPARCEVDFSTVRSRFRTGSGPLSATTDVPCSEVVAAERQPATLTISPAVAPATYTFELALLRKDGSELGRTTCSADTSPGLTSSAVCRPVP